MSPWLQVFDARPVKLLLGGILVLRATLVSWVRMVGAGVETYTATRGDLVRTINATADLIIAYR